MTDHFRKPTIALRSGPRTTVEKVRQPANTTVNVVGRKRNYDELQDQTRISASTNKPVPTCFNTRGFVRPLLTTDGPQIPASKIRIRIPPGTSANSRSEYSQRHDVPCTPTPANDPLLSLSHDRYGLPPQLVQNFAAIGVKSIYPWQSKCLRGPGLLSGQANLVYTAPTGGGKSLVADVLMLKKIIKCPGKKAILVLPYVALVQEKLRWLRSAVEGVSKDQDPGQSANQQQSIWRKRGDEDTIRVVGFFGGSKSRAAWADIDIAVCTIEKVRKASVLLYTTPTHVCPRRTLS